MSTVNFYDCIRLVLQNVASGSAVDTVFQAEYGRAATVGLGKTRKELGDSSLPALGITDGDELPVPDDTGDSSAIGELTSYREVVIFTVVERGKHIEVLNKVEAALVDTFHRQNLGGFRFEYFGTDSDYDSDQETAARAFSFRVTYTKYTL